jgi:hypothetical protein
MKVNGETNAGKSFWQQLETLDDDELASLSEAAKHVIADQEPSLVRYVEMPERPAGREISEELAKAGIAADEKLVVALLRNDNASRPLIVGVLQALGREPTLAADIEAAYRARREMLILDAGVLSAGALLLLVLKLKGIKIGAVQLDFYQAREGSISLVKRLLGL